ncbi:MAG TPA: anaerobic ribonucleoside-triphosphate reductase [Thermoclostridium sp.]|nr:anaerobic ribonucleoside-triphosphate reductase [Thermoclostridium sp.]
MIIKITNGEMSDREQQAYLKMGIDKYPNNKIRAMEINIDGEYVDVKYIFDDIPFQRIRRITGYLVGTLDRFNNAKRHEVDDRVKHSL